MRKAIVAVLSAGFALGALAQAEHYVQPHYDKNGNFVQGHYQTNPNSTLLDNYSTQGNVNPHTGQPGHVNPYQQPYNQPYQQPYQYQPKRCGYNAANQYVCI